MSQILRPEELLRSTQHVLRRVDEWVNMYAAAVQSELAFRSFDSEADAIAYEMNTIYGELSDLKDGLLTNFAWVQTWDTYAVTVEVGKPPRYTSLNINATAGTLTANVTGGLTNVFGDSYNGGNLFKIAADAGFSASDVIRLENCEDPENDGEYVLHASTSPTATVLTLAAAISGGVTNTSDETARIVLADRTPT